ncbi:MAG: tetratricopeptide repeat protein [Bacteroidia bacterium]|jgi:tetratricopeptide (TPR) repeat protein
MINQEEKNDGTTVDSNQNAVDSQANNEKGPFDGEERLDIDIGQEEKNDQAPSDGKSGFNVKTLIIVALLLLPVIYIVYKTMGNKPAEEQAAAQQQQVDIASFENAARTNPSYENLLNLSNVYINNNMAGKAIEPLERAIALKPNDGIAAYNNLGFAYTIIQQYKKGIEYCQKAVDIDSTFQLAKNNLNWAKSEQEKILNAIKEMDKVPSEQKDAGHYLLQGLNYLKLQEYDKAIEVWKTILVKEPKNVGALNNIGVAYMSMLKYKDAVDTFTKATEADPNDQLSKNNLNWALDEQKKASAPGVAGAAEAKK